MADEDIGFPPGSTDERDLLLQWLGYLRGAVLRNVEGLNDEQAHLRPANRLSSLVGIINHLTRVEWRWIDGAFLGVEVSRRESEFTPGAELSLEVAVRAYPDRAAATDVAVRAMTLDQLSDSAGS